MKHTVHVTVTMSVEIDTDDVKREFGKVNKKLILQEAIQKAKLEDVFESSANIFESYSDQIKVAQKGVGSY
jgi:L-amino acid N-acyltransferase YncA